MKNKKKRAPQKKPWIFVLIVGLGLSLGFNIYFLFPLGRPSQSQSSNKYPKFLDGNDEVSCENNSLSEESLPFCPQGDRYFILPRYFPLHSIYIGYEKGMEKTGLFQSALRAAMGTIPKTPLMIMVPREQVASARQEVAPYLNASTRSSVRFVMTPSKYTVWAQDYFEVLHNKFGEMSFLDLPYDSQLGEHIPTALSLACNSNLVGQSSVDANTVENLAGNFGGNIEPLTDKIVLVGNSMAFAQKEQLGELLSQQVIELDVNWLRVGHVDELISVLPKNGASECPFDILYASPSKALDLLKEASFEGKNQPLYLRYGFSGKEQKFNLWQCFGKGKKSLGCEVLLGSNRSYSKKIEYNISKIKKALKTQHPQCNKVAFLKVPVLFTASEERAKYGTSQDMAVAIDPNPVNNVLIGEELFLPKQALPLFHRYTHKLLKPYNKKLNFVDGEYVHHFGGGIHCSMNMRRACKKVL